MIFGFAAAAMGGFVLTAVPEWTGRAPLRGTPLALLAGAWLAGRVAVAVSGLTGAAFAGVVDLVYPVALCAIALGEIRAGRNWRNLPVAAVFAVLAAASALEHLESAGALDLAGLGRRLAIADIAFMVTIIGGRVVPAFTRNWLAARGEAALPAPFGWPDRAALAATALAGLVWSVLPERPETAILALIAGLIHAVRLARWRGAATLGEPLVWVLHAGYGWLAVGFVLLGAAIVTPGLPATAALHALTAGAFGTMILAVMTRASLGHTGRALHAGAGTTAAYVLVSLSAAGRVVSPMAGAAEPVLLTLSGLSWIAAFGLFVALYLPVLTRPPLE